MARQTRAQRRARRQAEAEASDGLTQRARTRQAQIRPQQQPPVKAQTGRRPQEERGFRRFLVETWGELKKVEWPTQNHVIQGTIVVLVACVVLGVFIWVCDIAFKHFVQQVLLR